MKASTYDQPSISCHSSQELHFLHQFPITCVGFPISKLVNCFLLCFAMPIDIMLFFALFTRATFVSFMFKV
jgi:hypothetical protein